jgi:hypothetical protein
MRDIRAGDHSFDDREKCSICGMSRKEFDDTGQKCTGRRPPKSEGIPVDEPE